MRLSLILGTAAVLLAGSALAQPATAPNPNRAPAPAATAPGNSAANPSIPGAPSAATPNAGARAGGAPAVGANSFTEAQAKTHIESQGYTGVSALTKDAAGMWRGKATKDGKQVDISLDTQGQVIVR